MLTVDRFSHREHIDRFSFPSRHDDEEVVQSGLALQPSQMLEMAQKNIPITTSNLGVTYDEGYSELEFEPPIQHQRGVDIGDMWEAQESVKKKFGKRVKELRADGTFNQSESK